MALSIELSRHLTDDDNQPLPKRLKLAENAFTSLDLMVSRKEDVILNWLCEVSKQSNDIAVWQTLKRCLEFQHIHSHSSIIKAPVKAALIETLMNGLETIDELELARVIVNCYQLILINREMHRYFVYRPILVIDMLEQLLSQSYINSCDDGINKLPELQDCIIDSLNVINECHRRLTNKTELRNDVIERLVYKLCIFCEKVANDKVKSAVTKCMQRFIFDKSIEMEMMESDNWAQELFVALTKYAGSVSNNDDLTLVISHIFHAAIVSYKSSASKIDRIYRSILNCAPSTKLKIQVCSDLFRQLNDITLDIQNKINETPLIVYYHEIIDEVLAFDRLDVNAYKCLDGMTNFNPLIVEGKLQNIFKKILLMDKSDDVIKSSYANLLSDVLDACIRLRRENKLVPWMLMALNDSLTNNPDHGVDIDHILPSDFPNKFTASINNMTNALAMEVLMCFIHHLNTSSLQSPDSGMLSIFLGVTSRLTIAFLEGIHVFDYSTPLIMQRKFVAGLVKLGKALEKLIIVVTPMNKYETIAIHVLSMINCWQRIIAVMKNYAPESPTEEDKLSITQIINNIHQQINRKDNLNANKNMNQLLICCRLERNRIDGITLSDDNEILYDIENDWMILMDNCSYIIANLDDSQLSCLARVILSDVYDTKITALTNTRIKSRVVQQNKKLITALIFEIFLAIKSVMKDSSSTTSNLLTGIIAKNSLEDQRTGKILKVCKKLLSNARWTQNENSIPIIRYLEILLMLPLLHLSVELKTIICLVVFSMTKEWPNSPDMIDLCHKILIDISEDGNIDILQYMYLQCFIEELSKYPAALSKVLECSLRNVSNYDAISTFIKSHKDIKDCAVPTLIECIEKIKPRLKPDEKVTVKKIERKWIKRILCAVESDTKNPHQVRSLRIAFKAAVATKKLDESMLEVIHSTVHNIFQTTDKDEDHPKLRHKFHHDDVLVNEGLEIIKILLQPALKRNERVNQILNKDIVKRTWSLTLKRASPDIVSDLLDDQRTTLKILKKVLTLLHKQTVDAHDHQDVSLFRNCMTIWSCVARADMTTTNHIRQLYLQQLIQYFSTVTSSNDDRLSVLKLCTVIINSKRVHITEKIIDLILVTTEHFLTNLKTISTFVCDQILILSLAFLTHRVNAITDRLPALLALYRKVIRFIIDESRQKDSLCTEHQLQCLALNANKLAVAFVKLKKDTSKVCPYIIADVVEMYSQGVVPTHVKGPLDDSIGMFLSNCDHHAIPLLFRALPSATQEIFKTLYDTYTKFYKFVGKI